jgi:hypothetical protein
MVGSGEVGRYRTVVAYGGNRFRASPDPANHAGGHRRATASRGTGALIVAGVSGTVAISGSPKRFRMNEMNIEEGIE